MVSGGLFWAGRMGVARRRNALMIKGFTRLSVSGLVIFCGDLCGVEQGEEDAAEGGLAACGVVPLL